ncbi:Auxin-induced protein [Thalictrum thalictroides]|uniref:Auxin-induced protein n=1 Tax=Thalictrum thalictroides TaxID=46969 RepID=A0A7J6W4D5_THATH|nr:Auxin-induced protein [Thalictrum thalictroides]
MASEGSSKKIRQIVQFKQVMKRWKTMGIGRKSNLSISDSDSETDSTADSYSSSSTNRRIPSGFLAVYVGQQRCRFVIPTRFLNLPIFVSLLKKSEEEYGFQSSGGLILPCEVRFFKGVLKFLHRDEHVFGKMKLDEFLKMFSEVGFDPCREGKDSVCKGFTPLLQKARV